MGLAHGVVGLRPTATQERPSRSPRGSGIRQGCVLSALLYVLVQEVQLRMIRRSSVRGVRIPGPDGETTTGADGRPRGTVEVKERSLVDDTLVLLRDASDLPTLLDEISRFERLSNHKMQLSKSTLFLMGRYMYSKLDPVDGDTEDEQLLRASGTGNLCVRMNLGVVRHRCLDT